MIKYLSTYQFQLTGKGEKALMKLFLAEEKRPEWEMLNNISFGVDSPITGKKHKLLISLIHKGLVEPDRRSLDELLGDIPISRGGPKLRKCLAIYIKIARGESVPEEDLDNLRNSLVSYLGKWGREWWPLDNGPNVPNEKITERLRSAKTRSELVLAIDRAMGLVHGEGRLLQYATGTTESRGEREFKPIVEKILGKLANE